MHERTKPPLTTGLICILVLLAACANTGPTDPFPTHMRMVLENDHVQVRELFASPGASASMHLQPPGVRISLSRARFEWTLPDGTTSIVDQFPGQVWWVDEPERYAWRLLAGNAHLVFVDVRSAATGSAPVDPPLARDHSTIVDAGESEPGSIPGNHRRPYPDLRFRTGHGALEQSLHPFLGHRRWRGAGAHGRNQVGRCRSGVPGPALTRTGEHLRA